MPSWTFLIFFTTVPTYYVSHCSCLYLYADVMHENLFHTTMQFNLMEVLYLKLGYPSSQQPLPVPWLHLLMKTNVTSLVQSLLMEWQCRIAPLHVSGFHWKQIQTRLKFLLKKKENQTLYTLTFWHQSFTFNSNKSPTWCNNFSVYYPDVCLQLNVFRAFSRPPSGAQWLQWQPLVLPSYRGDSRPARPQAQHNYHHDTKVKLEAATAVIELLMMGGKTPETCWAVNKRQANKLKNCCIRLVIYLNCMMMHGLTNLKFNI